MPRSDRRRSSDAFVPGGRISEYTCSSRRRRAMSWVYWEAKSRMATVSRGVGATLSVMMPADYIAVSSARAGMPSARSEDALARLRAAEARSNPALRSSNWGAAPPDPRGMICGGGIVRLLRRISFLLIVASALSACLFHHRRPRPEPAIFPVTTEWTAQIGDALEGPPARPPIATDGARVFVATVDGAVRGLDGGTGNVRWTVPDRPGTLSA